MMSNNKIPILLADDTTLAFMEKYIEILKANKVVLAGIDIQNSVEIERNEQRYQIFDDGLQKYQGRIRKSSNELYRWRAFINKRII